MIGGEILQALLERGHDPHAAAVASVGCLRVADADLGDETDVAPAGTKRACKRLLEMPMP